MDATAFQLQHLPCRIQIPKSPDGQDRNRMNIAWLVAGICFALGAVTMDLSMILIHRPGKSGSREVHLLSSAPTLNLSTFQKVFPKLFRLYLPPSKPMPWASEGIRWWSDWNIHPSRSRSWFWGWKWMAGDFQIATNMPWNSVFLKFHQFFLIEFVKTHSTSFFFSFPSLLLWRNARAKICKLRSLEVEPLYPLCPGCPRYPDATAVSGGVYLVNLGNLIKPEDRNWRQRAGCLCWGADVWRLLGLGVWRMWQFLRVSQSSRRL